MKKLSNKRERKSKRWSTTSFEEDSKSLNSKGSISSGGVFMFQSFKFILWNILFYTKKHFLLMWQLLYEWNKMFFVMYSNFISKSYDALWSIYDIYFLHLIRLTNDLMLNLISLSSTFKFLFFPSIFYLFHFMPLFFYYFISCLIEC